MRPICVLIILIVLHGENSKAQSSDSLLEIKIKQLITENRNLINKEELNAALDKIDSAITLQNKFNKIDKALKADVIYNKARTLQRLNRILESLNIYQKAKELYEQNNLTTTVNYTSLLINLASIYNYYNQYKIAIDLIKTCVEIRSKTVGVESREYNAAILALARYYAADEEFAIADSLFDIVINYRKKTFKSNPHEYFNALNTRAYVYYISGKLNIALSEYENVLTETRKCNCVNSDLIYQTLNNIGALYIESGNIKKADSLWKNIGSNEFFKGVGPLFYYNKSNYYIMIGKLDSCKFYLDKTNSDIIKEGSIDSTLLGRLYNLYGGYYLDIADHKNAEKYLVSSYNILIKVKASKYLLSQTSNNLALFYLKINNLETASHYLNESYKLSNFTNLGALANLGLIKMKQDSLFEAENIFSTVLNSDNTNSNQNIYKFFETSINYANLLRIKKKYDLAISRLEAMLENVGRYGSTQGKISRLEHLIAICYLEKGDTTQAKMLFTKQVNNQYVPSMIQLTMIYLIERKLNPAKMLIHSINKILDNDLLEKKSYLTEAELSYLRYDYYLHLSNLLNFNLSYKDPEIIQQSLKSSLLFKNILLKKSHNKNSVIHNNGLISEELNRWKILKKRLFYQYQYIQDESTNSLEEEINKLEKEIFRHSVVDLQKDNLAESIQEKLKTNEVLLEFVEYFAEFDLSPNYGVFIVRNKELVFIRLCSKGELEKLLTAQVEYSNYRIQSNISKKLYELIWTNIASNLNKIKPKTIYYSPAGLLHSLNLESLSNDNNNTFLTEIFQFVRLIDSESLISSSSFNQPIDRMFAFGGIDYQRITYTNGLKLENLPGSTMQLDAIKLHSNKGKLNVYLFSNAHASEDTFRKIKWAPNTALHICAHGSYSSDSLYNKTETDNNTSASIYMRNFSSLNSGVYLFPKNEITGEDGFLSAAEISLLDLSNIELVTLASCESASGKILDNEGIYGLQRSFLKAGVKNIIMSLWKVNDLATEKLMERFYYFLLVKKHSIPISLDLAKKTLRDIKNNDGIYPYRDPFYWAGFVTIPNIY